MKDATITDLVDTAEDTNELTLAFVDNMAFVVIGKDFHETHSCQELNYSGATPDSFPMLLWPTFPRYFGPYSCATPVHHWTGPDST